MASAPPLILKKRYIIYLLICLIAIYVIVPQISLVRGSLPLVRDADRGLALLAIASALFSYVAAAGVYSSLALSQLRFSRTLFMQFAAMFANRLLPAGIGGMGINYLYLKKQKHSTVQATSVVAANNTLGFVGHMMLIAFLVFFAGAALPGGKTNPQTWLLIFAPAILFAVLMIIWPRFRAKVGGFLSGVGKQLLQYRKHPAKLAVALACSLLLTLSNVLALQLSSQAVGVELSIVAIILIFTFGLSVGTATPTPGSLGGIEAGLVAGMIAYNVDPPSALGAVLLYRLVSYWLPLMLGATLFIIARKRQYF